MNNYLYTERKATCIYYRDQINIILKVKKKNRDISEYNT